LRHGCRRRQAPPGEEDQRPPDGGRLCGMETKKRRQGLITNQQSSIMIQDAIQPMLSPAEMIGMFTHVIASDRPIEAIAQDVPGACAANKFSLLTTYAYHDILAEKGFPIERKAFVYEICHARTASLMLTGHPE